MTSLVRALAACVLAAAPMPDQPTAESVLAKVELESDRRHAGLREYTGSRVYKLQNQRFGKEADATVFAKYRAAEGERFTVVTRSGSDRLSGIIDQVLSTEAAESVPPANAAREISAANYRVRLLGAEIAAGRQCYVLELTPRRKQRSLIHGKAWVDVASSAVVRLDGQFAASASIFLGAPRIVEDFVETGGFWLPGHVWSVTSSVLLGPTTLEIEFSNYRLADEAAAGASVVKKDVQQ
jgi:negative regulator of sigma E activity